jgi:hypothetical protein
MFNDRLRSTLLALVLVTSAAAHADETPEQRMARRFPQPVKVGDLIGLPVYDDSQSTLGYVREVVRTPAGKIQLIVAYSPVVRVVELASGRADRGCRHIRAPDRGARHVAGGVCEGPDLVRRGCNADFAGRHNPDRADAPLIRLA